MTEPCGKCGTIEGTSTFPALDVASCGLHGESLHVHVSSDPTSPGHGHHRECLRCLVDELALSRGRIPDLEPAASVDVDVRPDAYTAEGILRIAGLVVSLDGHGDLRWPLAVLLRELVGRPVRIRVDPIVARAGASGGERA